MAGLRSSACTTSRPRAAAAASRRAARSAGTGAHPLVFFDWDRVDLTDRAGQITAEAAENARRVQVARIEVARRADR